MLEKVGNFLRGIAFGHAQSVLSNSEVGVPKKLEFSKEWPVANMASFTIVSGLVQSTCQIHKSHSFILWVERKLVESLRRETG